MFSQKFISVQIRAELIPWLGQEGGRDELRWGADGQCSEFLTSFLYQKHHTDEHHKGLAQEQICQAPVME